MSEVPSGSYPGQDQEAGRYDPRPRVPPRTVAREPSASARESSASVRESSASARERSTSARESSANVSTGTSTSSSKAHNGKKEQSMTMVDFRFR